jgi:hypothetical protein
MKAILALLLSVFSSVVLAVPAAPQPGLWWSPNEGGRGYSIDTQGDLLVLAMFAYGNDGRMQWYYADGPLQSGGARWSGALLKYDFGQPLNGAWRPAAVVGNDGFVTIDFYSRTTGVITLPGGRAVAIERFNFGVGAPPQALLGQWLFAYSIGSSSYADRYNLTTIGSATSTGNGVVVDTARRGAFEYQLSGSFAGRIVGFRFSSTGTVLDQYLFTLQLEEGRGSWVSPITYTEYGMNGYKTHTPSGVAKSLEAADERDLRAKGTAATAKGTTLEEMSAAHPELGALARGMWMLMVAE